MAVKVRLMILNALLMISLLLVGCQGSSGNSSAAPVPINTQNIVGSWEVVSVSVNGMTGPAKMTSAANEAGYQDSYGKLQYQITDKKFRVISSDELAVTFSSERDYHLEGNKLVPQNSPNDSVSGFEVLSLTQNSMTIRPSGKSEPAGLQFILSRINERDLATNKLKPIAQSVSYKIRTPKVELAESLTANYPSSFRVGDSISISCIYRKKRTPNFEVNAYGYRVTPDGKLITGGNFPSISFDGTARFDLSKRAEEVNFTVVPTVADAGFQGTYLKNSNRADFYLGSGGSCAVSIKRVKRNLDITANCNGVDVNSSVPRNGSSTGSITLAEKCVLDFL